MRDRGVVKKGAFLYFFSTKAPYPAPAPPAPFPPGGPKVWEMPAKRPFMRRGQSARRKSDRRNWMQQNNIFVALAEARNRPKKRFSFKMFGLCPILGIFHIISKSMSFNYRHISMYCSPYEYIFFRTAARLAVYCVPLAWNNAERLPPERLAILAMIRKFENHFQIEINQFL